MVKILLARLAVIIATITTFIVFVPAPTMAVDVTKTACVGAEESAACIDSQSTNDTTNNPLFGPDGIITIAIKGLSLILAIIAVVVLMLAGLRYITSQGDSAKITQSRNAVIYAIVGLVVALMAQVIVSLVLSRI